MPDSSSVDRPVMVGQCSSPNLSTLYFACAVATIAGVREAPASIGYEAWLISKGCTPALARLTAALMVKRGKRIASDSAREPSVVEALRTLSRPTTASVARRRRVTSLLQAWEETSILETIFDHANVVVCLFAKELQRCADGACYDFSAIAEMARAAIAVWRPRRGPKVSAASAAHEFFLKHVVPDVDRPRAYTRSESAEDFVDEVTKATRREFNEPDFDPQPSCRRIVRGRQPFEVR